MPDRSAASRNPIVAVIDIGSNSGRVMVFERDAARHLRLLTGSRAPLRLVHDVDSRGELSDATMARTAEAVRDFRAIATGAGAHTIVAVATAAMRDASNGALFAERLRRELGTRVTIIGGLAEARFGFVGAVRGLAVSSGLLFDVGGGSMQITRFAQRRRIDGVSLPFGALRLSEKFLDSDPPTAKQIRKLREHVRNRFAKVGVARLRAGDRLVGTGGTLRNLAKIDHQMRHYPIDALHGYELSTEHLEAIVDHLASIRQKRRDDVPGLSAERADSIVGGAVAIHTLAEYARASSILVSGQGVREGIALGLLRLPVGTPETVRETSLQSLVSRFGGWHRQAATRRRGVAALLQRAIEPRAPASIVAAIDRAARVLDIGRSLDAVNRHKHVADILLHTDLIGFTHGELALVAAIVSRAGDRHADILPLALENNTLTMEQLDRAAILVALADEIEARCAGSGRIAVTCRIGRTVTLSVPGMPSWLVKDLDKRFERAFGRALVVRH